MAMGEEIQQDFIETLAIYGGLCILVFAVRFSMKLMARSCETAETVNIIVFFQNHLTINRVQKTVPKDTWIRFYQRLFRNFL